MTAYTFDQIIDFTRTSAATYVANTGFVTQTPASRNLLTYTQEFDNAAWTKTNANAYPFDPASATLGPELVTNGTFDSGTTGWTDITGSWAVTGGALAGTSIPASAYGPYSNGVATAGRIYLATFTITVASGSLLVRVGNTESSAYSTGGTFSQYFTATSSAATIFQLRAGGAGFTGTIDNVSVREVIGGLITAPDGTLTGDALVANPGAAVHNVGQNTSVTGAPYTWSVYAKASTSNFMQLVHTANANTYANFNLATGSVGTVGSLATATMTSVGNGWYRCSLTFTPSTGSFMRVAMISSATAAFNESWTATGTESIYVWGAQLEAASAASTYTRNVGGVYPPRFDYDPVTLAPRGLLIEEQRTNLLLRSEEFDNAVWARSGSGAAAVPVVTANAGISPDGTMNADRVQFDCTDNTNVNNRSSLTQSVTVVNAAPYRGSLYVKAFDAGNVGKTIRITSDGLGTVVATLTANWTRVEFGGTSTFTGTNYIIECRGTYTTQTADVLIWGAQLESGAFATSYIPTAASQVTRTADLATVTGANFSRWYNQSAGSFVIEFQTLVTGAVPTSLFALTADGNTSKRFVYIGSGAEQASTFDGTTILSAAGDVTGSVAKVASAYDASARAIVSNGGAVTSGAVAAGYSTASSLNIGGGFGGNLSVGHIRRIRYYPTRLSNAQLQALTA